MRATSRSPLFQTARTLLAALPLAGFTLVLAGLSLVLTGCALVQPTLIKGPDYTFTFQLPDTWLPLSEDLIVRSRLHEFGGPSFRLDAAYSPRSGAKLELPVLVTGILADTKVGKMQIPAANAVIEDGLANQLASMAGVTGKVLKSRYFPSRKILLVESAMVYHKTGVALQLLHAFYYTKAELFTAYGVCLDHQPMARQTLREALLSAFIDPDVTLEQTTELSPHTTETTPSTIL